ncbi:GNAT family N-acetyltransferase [Roseomonas haemaphysalidis]|uniref:GNAT family N-acetyltransferase n=1 Tax=Roseomonas haemaphysalidis TaxID=2768162 RepID=A0ABS3KYB7_9PROT|nr:GNAT family N-acetyltransferase [Roseomonas haemaphysalidis]MBO1081633.1 GNAT family N-acetyltransferase [Roseomonas haemaphysalidis]
MSGAPRISLLLDLPEGLDKLRAKAAGEGFRFMEKLAAEWLSGANRFAGPGEVLLGAFQATELVAVGGLNRDPYADQAGIGRLRHLYVKKSARRSGLGTTLVLQLLGHAEGTFHSVRLKTDTSEAADFYVSLGFWPVQDRTATHVRWFQRS